MKMHQKYVKGLQEVCPINWKQLSKKRAKYKEFVVFLKHTQKTGYMSSNFYQIISPGLIITQIWSRAWLEREMLLFNLYTQVIW